MFRPLLGHHQVVLSLQSNCIAIISVPGGRRDLVHNGQIHELNMLVPIFVISILYIIFCSYCYTLLKPVVTPGRCVPERYPSGFRCAGIYQK